MPVASPPSVTTTKKTSPDIAKHFLGGTENPYLRTTKLGCKGRFRTLDYQSAMNHWPEKGVPNTSRLHYPDFTGEKTAPRDAWVHTQGHTTSQGLPDALPTLAGTFSAQTHLARDIEEMKAEIKSNDHHSLFMAGCAKGTRLFRSHYWDLILPTTPCVDNQAGSPPRERGKASLSRA